jgi:hypothetical protein
MMQAFYNHLTASTDQQEEHWQVLRNLCETDVDQIDATNSFLSWDWWTEE